MRKLSEKEERREKRRLEEDEEDEETREGKPIPMKEKNHRKREYK